MDYNHNHNNSDTTQLLGFPNDILNEIFSILKFKDIVALCLVCKKFQLLLRKNKFIPAFQLTISNIKKSMSTSMFQPNMFESLIMHNYTWEEINFRNFINLKTLEITDSCKVDPFLNRNLIQLVLPEKLRAFKLTSTFQPQDHGRNIIFITAIYCIAPLEALELNGTVNEGKATPFMLIYPFITSVQTISLSNTNIGFMIFNHMQNKYAIELNGIKLLLTPFMGKHCIQLCVNNSINSPIEIFKTLGNPEVSRWDTISHPNAKEATTDPLPAIYAFSLMLLEDQSIVLTRVHEDTSISPQKWLHKYGQIPQRLPDN